MIPRYSRPDMVALWQPQARFRIWFEIEAHATDALAELGVVPREAAEKIWAMNDAEFDVDRIDAIVPPGTDIGTLDQAYVPPAIQLPGLRRRRAEIRAAA